MNDIGVAGASATCASASPASITTAMPARRAIRIIADDKIEAAIRAGEFDALPGLGQPHPIFDEPYDPNWWIRKKLQREGLQAPGHEPLG